MKGICSQCGAELPDGELRSRCPICLLAFGLETEAEELPVAGGRPDASPRTATRRFGDYELLEEIAHGGMGVVYRARQRSLNRTVALKLILAGPFASKLEILRFQAEAEAAANLRHPNIVAIYDTGEHDGQHYFSMEYVPGRNLADIGRDGRVSSARAARYAKTIADAIHYAHEQGTLHRDLKPSNVLIDSNDQPRITDFGLAKRLRGDSGVTVTGQLLGSPGFMPPEQMSGHASQLGPPCDVYGVGAILYHMLTGQPPFHASTVEEILRQMHEREPISPRLLNGSVPLDLETVCLKCLEKEPAKRYQTAKELAEELARFERGEPILARPVSPGDKLLRWCRRKPTVASLFATVAALLAVLAIGGAVASWRIRQSASQLRQRNYAADVSLGFRALAENPPTADGWRQGEWWAKSKYGT